MKSIKGFGDGRGLVSVISTLLVSYLSLRHKTPIKCTSTIFIFPNFRCLVTSNEKCTLGIP